MKPRSMSLILAVTMGSLAIAAQTSITAAGGALLFSDGDFDAQSLSQGVGAPWGPVGGAHTVTAASQSPYENVYPVSQ